MVTLLDEASYFLVEPSKDQLLVVADVPCKEGKLVPLDVLLTHHYFLVVCNIEHLNVVVMRNDQQGSAVILETNVIYPSTQAVDRKQYLIHGVDVLERSIVDVILHLGLNDKWIFGVAEAAGDDFDREISRPDGE